MVQRDGGFAIEDIAHFDDEALATFLDPHDGGVKPMDLAHAMQGCEDALAHRVASALPSGASAEFVAAQRHTTSKDVVDDARRRILDILFWPLVYWNRPDDYEQLISGEEIHSGVLDEIDVDDADVCDIGAGTGRFTLVAAARARHVVAVDAVPELLRRLDAQARLRGFTNIEIRRGGFSALPLEDHSVDVAVACSSFTTTGPHGGDRALHAAERIVKPGGRVAVIWPTDRAWFVARGFRYVRLEGNDALRFADIETAVRLSRRYYSEAAARWVAEHRQPSVPYAVLGVSPPNDVCIKRID